MILQRKSVSVLNDKNPQTYPKRNLYMESKLFKALHICLFSLMRNANLTVV